MEHDDARALARASLKLMPEILVGRDKHECTAAAAVAREEVVGVALEPRDDLAVSILALVAHKHLLDSRLVELAFELGRDGRLAAAEEDGDATVDARAPQRRLARPEPFGEPRHNAQPVEGLAARAADVLDIPKHAGMCDRRR